MQFNRRRTVAQAAARAQLTRLGWNANDIKVLRAIKGSRQMIYLELAPDDFRDCYRPGTYP